MTITAMPDDRPGAKHPGGRKTKFTTDVAGTIVDTVRAGNYLETAAAAAGVHPSTVYRWLQQAEQPRARSELREFRDALTRARAEAEVHMVDTVMTAAAGGAVTRRVIRTLRDGSTEEEVSYAPPDGRVALEYLSRAFPQRWARRAALEVTGQGGGPIQIASPEQVASLAERVQQALAGGVVDGEVVDDEEETDA